MNKYKKIVIFGIAIVVVLSLLWIDVIYNISNSISEVEQQKTVLESELGYVNNEINNVSSQIFELKDNINQTQINLNENISELRLLNSGKRYELHNPTYAEAEEFLSLDKTNEINKENFVCRHYAQTVNNNAENHSLICAYVCVDLSGPEGHACIAFNTTDEGIVYFEPQYDYKVNLEVGKDYWADCVVCPEGYYFKRSSDDFVRDFRLFW